MRKTLAASILTVMLTGLMAWAGNEIKTAVKVSRENSIKIEYQEKTLDKIERQVNDIHWALIKRAKLTPPGNK